MIEISELSAEHPAVKAAYAMADAYKVHDSLLPALEEVMFQHPEVEESELVAMWLALNANDKLEG